MATDPKKMVKARKKLNKLVKKRTTLKKRKDEGKVTLLGNLRRKRIQKKINKNIAAKKNKADAKKTTTKKTTTKKKITYPDGKQGDKLFKKKNMIMSRQRKPRV